MDISCHECGHKLTKIIVIEREKKIVALMSAEVTQYYQEKKYEEQYLKCTRCANLCFSEILLTENPPHGLCVTCGGTNKFLITQEENEYDNKKYIYFRQAWQCWTCRDHILQLNTANTCYITKNI